MSTSVSKQSAMDTIVSLLDCLEQADLYKVINKAIAEAEKSNICTNTATEEEEEEVETKATPEDINAIIEESYVELNDIMDGWCKTYDENFSGGKMRGDRGVDIENYVKNVIHKFKTKFNINVKALKGDNDKKELSLKHNNLIIKKEHQVDIHIYKDEKFIAVIECKAYLDSCYYTRACEDFRLFDKFNYDIKKYLFSLENSIDENTKLFTDVHNDNVCDDIFYVLDGKRSSSKPIYDKKYRKPINKDKLTYFIKSLQTLFGI
jgi:hypothetical protein